MNKKWIYGIGLIALAMIVVLLFNTLQNHNEIKELKKNLIVTQEISQNNNDNRPPPPGKTFEGGGHWHGDEWHDAPHDPIMPETQFFEHTPFLPPESDGNTFQAKVLANSNIPKYSDLKLMSGEDLKKIHDDSDKIAQDLSKEVDKLNDELVKVNVNLTRNAKTPEEYDSILAENIKTIAPIRDRYYAALTDYFIHEAIASKARHVIRWRVSEKNKHLIKSKNYPSVIVNVKEPFD